MRHLSFIISILLISICCTDVFSQLQKTIGPSEKPMTFNSGDSSAADSYRKIRTALDSIIDPVISKMLVQNQMDSITLETCDKIITVAKEVYIVHIYNITYTDIRFTYPSDDVLNELSRSLISQILYEDGRIDVFVPLEDRTVRQYQLVDTSRIIIKNQKDWMKVKTTGDRDAVSNLVSKGNIKARFEAGKGNVDNDYLERNALNILKKKAAGLKAHYVLIESKFFHKAFGDLPSVEIIATAYGYE